MKNTTFLKPSKQHVGQKVLVGAEKTPGNDVARQKGAPEGLAVGRTWVVGVVDSSNYGLYHWTGKRWAIQGYYGTVAGAMNDLISQGIRDTQLVDLKTVVAKIDELRADIEKALHQKE